MRAKFLAAGVVVLLATVVSAGSYAQSKKKLDFYVPSYDEEIWGTWVNTAHSGGPYFPQKVVNNYWGSIDIFMKATDPAPSFRGAHTLVEKWKDREGNIWYKLYWRDNGGPSIYYEIDRISNNGSTFEFCFDTREFPMEDDLKSKNLSKQYRVFYRQ
jgi:hypothetical protein